MMIRRLIGHFCQMMPLTFLAVGASLFAVVARPADSSPTAADDLSHWLKQTELSIQSGEIDGIDAAASTWVDRLEATGGTENPELVEVLSLRLAARAREGLEADPQTLAIARRLVALLETLDRHDTSLVVALLRLGSALSTRGEFTDAVAPLERAAALARDLDEGSATYGTALSHLAWNYRLLDQLDRAEDIALESLAVREALGPEGDGERSWNFGQLASIALARGAVDRALTYNTLCLELREKTMGPDALWTGDACEMQGWILAEHGEHAEADEYFSRALVIFETIVGPKSQRVARVLNDLGGSATYQARNDDARRLYERALAIQRELYGENSPMVARVWHNLGNVLADLGDDEGAIDRENEALEILERGGNGRSADATRTRNAIARLLLRQGRLSEAQTTAERALSDAHASSGAGSFQTFAARLVLAESRASVGKVAEAFALVDSAVTESARGMGTDHPLHAQALHERARLERDAGRFSVAESDADSARSIRRRILGDQHPDTVRSTLLVAELEIDRGRPEVGLALALNAETASREHALSLFDGFAERQALRYARERPNGLSVAARAWLEAPEKCADQIEDFWNAVAASRQLVLRTMAARASKARTLLSATEQRLAEARGRLARLVMASLHSDEDLPSTNQLQLAIEEKERAERAVGDEIDRQDSDLVDNVHREMSSVGKLLPATSALVAFRRILVSDSSARYFVFLLKAGESKIRLLDLGPATSIEEATADWVEELSRGELRSDRSPRTSRLACRTAGERVRKIVWDPIKAAVPDSRTLFLVPDGRLREIEWAALPVDADNYLVEFEPAIRILLSERDAVRESPTVSAIGSVLSVGAVEYVRSDSGSLLESGAAPLPASGEEAEMVARVWSGTTVTLLRGRNANEMRVRSELEQAQLIHMGTHAFYSEQPRIPGTLDRSPLLCAGLVLAKPEPTSEEERPEADGTLTAEEICALDLSRSQVIVLAACSTGRGVALPGEGTLGLSWALRVAGARGIVLAGWDVEDSDARSWMETFHKTLRAGASLDAAVRRAHLTVLGLRRDQNLSTHPYHWAAFRAIEGGI